MEPFPKVNAILAPDVVQKLYASDALRIGNVDLEHIIQRDVRGLLSADLSAHRRSPALRHAPFPVVIIAGPAWTKASVAGASPSSYAFDVRDFVPTFSRRGCGLMFMTRFVV